MIYVASPYTHEDPKMMHWRYSAVLHYTACLTLKGEFAYSPIVHCHHINEMFKDKKPGWEFWKNHDLYMLRHCMRLHVLCLPGWEISVGVTAEIQAASNMLMPVEYIDDFTPPTQNGASDTNEDSVH